MSHIIKVIVGSKNPVKIHAAENAISAYFPNAKINIQGIAAPSKVASQPMTASETRTGAINRVNFCRNHYDADFYIAFEGGLEVTIDGAITFAYLVISDGDQQSVGRSASLPLPKVVHQQLNAGKELGDVMDDLFGTVNIKQQGGAIGLLTNNLESRGSIYTQALILALAPLINKALYVR